MLSTLRFCCRAPLNSAFRSNISTTIVRNSAQSHGTRRAGQATTMKQKLMAPVGDNAFGIGRGVVALGAGLGLGALCIYGSGVGGHIGYREKSALWPDYVKSRVRSTYAHLAGSIGIAAASAAAVFRSPPLMRFAASGSIWGFLGMVALMIGSGMVCRGIPYQENDSNGLKKLAWAVHSGIIGLAIAPLGFIGGPLVLRAAWYTAGVVGGLSAIAMCAPDDKFVNIGGPLAMGFGLVFMATLASVVLPPTTALGASLYSISVYGGLVLFSGFLLYDTQKVMHRAESTPQYSTQPFDPINNSISIFMDVVNIFMRIAMILANGGNRKK